MESQPRVLITLWSVFTKIWDGDDPETRTYRYQTDENGEPAIVNEIYIFANDIRAFSRQGADVSVNQYTGPGNGWVLYAFANESLAKEAIEDIIKEVTS